MMEDEKEYPCPYCGAQPGEDCFAEEEPPFVERDPCGIHVERLTGGGPMTLRGNGDGTFTVVDN